MVGRTRKDSRKDALEDALKDGGDVGKKADGNPATGDIITGKVAQYYRLEDHIKVQWKMTKENGFLLLLVGVLMILSFLPGGKVPERMKAMSRTVPANRCGPRTGDTQENDQGGAADQSIIMDRARTAPGLVRTVYPASASAGERVL